MSYVKNDAMTKIYNNKKQRHGVTFGGHNYNARPIDRHMMRLLDNTIKHNVGGDALRVLFDTAKRLR